MASDGDGERAFIPIAAPIIGQRERDYVGDAVASGWVSSAGKYIAEFEAGFANLCGTRYAVAVSNGTAALHLALHALGVGAGDEVIVPDLTFAATAHAVLQTGARPVLVDVEPDTWCIDPAAVERAISPRTKAIVPVHLFGHPADTDHLSALARAHQLHILEDAAEAHGATVAGRRVGSIGDVGAFSFYGNKIITTGEGGMLTTDDDALADRLRFLRDHGMTAGRRYHHTELAFNYRITNLQAALGLAQLEQIDRFIEAKRRIFGWYAERLAGCTQVALNTERAGCRSVYWMSCVVLAGGEAADRDAVCAALRADGVDSRPFFVPMSELPHLRDCRAMGASGDGCPVARRLSMRGISLPSGCGLECADVDRVAASLRAALERG